MKSVLKECSYFEQIINEMDAQYPRAKAYCEQCRYDLFMARAMAKINLGNLAESQADFNKALTFNYTKTFNSYQTQIGYYAACGNVDSVLSIMDRFPYEDTDTIQRLYRRKLARLEQAYRVAGDTATARHYQQRVDTLTQIIETKEKQEGTAMNAMKYEARQYKLELDDLSKRTKNHFISLLVLLLLLFMVLVIINYIYTTNNTITIKYIISCKI